VGICIDKPADYRHRFVGGIFIQLPDEGRASQARVREPHGISKRRLSASDAIGLDTPAGAIERYAHLSFFISPGF
jgi:hypothetical protein